MSTFYALSLHKLLLVSPNIDLIAFSLGCSSLRPPSLPRIPAILTSKCMYVRTYVYAFTKKVSRVVCDRSWGWQAELGGEGPALSNKIGVAPIIIHYKCYDNSQAGHSALERLATVDEALG